jgi:hypothetical protein
MQDFTMSERNTAEPEAARVIGPNGSNEALKISIGKKKLHSDRNLARMTYMHIIINGVQYCRQHLMLRCHICEVDNSFLQEGCDEERQRLGIRGGGDPRLNERAEYWREFIKEKQLELTLKRDLLIMKYGKDHACTYPEHWMNYKREGEVSERELMIDSLHN